MVPNPRTGRRASLPDPELMPDVDRCREVAFLSASADLPEA
jgi:hypothetical protein